MGRAYPRGSISLAALGNNPVFHDFYKQKTADEIKQCDRSSDVCSSDLLLLLRHSDGLEPSAVWAQLGIGKSEYYREHSRGVHAVASVLWQRSTSDDQGVLHNVVLSMPSVHRQLPSVLTS